MRKLVFATLSAALVDTAVGDRIYQRSAAGVGAVPANPQKPFVIYGEGVTDPYEEVSETSDAERIPYQVYFYDHMGSYIQIGKLARTIEPAIKALVGQYSPSGALCLGVSWGGISQDFVDPDYEASVRFASFTVTGSHHEVA